MTKPPHKRLLPDEPREHRLIISQLMGFIGLPVLVILFWLVLLLSGGIG